MEWSYFSVSMLFFLSSSLIICTGKDRISPGELLKVTETITSASDNFALGFFSPHNDSKRYVGIWYNKIREQTIVWVANRENPLTDSSGAIAVMDDGNLAVLNGRNNVLWTSNASVIGRNSTTAILLDNGNLELRTTNQSVVWQSFDHPIGILLSGMKLWLSLKTGQNISLVSWKDVDDPTPGEFSIGIDPHVPRQVKLWRGSETYWRRNVWQEVSATMYSVPYSHSQVIYYTISADDNEASYLLTFPENSIKTILKLNPTGLLELKSWDENLEKWNSVWSMDNRCWVYGQCGPFGICNFNHSSAGCSCLKGFKPKFQKEWEMGNWSGGCERQRNLECATGDGFYTPTTAKLPDNSISLGNLSAKECESECLNNCSCTAYSYNNFSSWKAWRCLIWVGDLFDLTENSDSVVDLNFRLAGSELAENNQTGKSKQGRGSLAIIVPLVTIGCLIIGALGYIFWNRVKKQGRRKINKAIKLKASNTLECGDNTVELPLYTFSSIVAATDNFSIENKLGEGGFGPVYKGNLQQGLEIAVKRFSKSSAQGEEEFRNEVQLIAKLQHKNLVRLLGWCIQEEEKILIYEHMPNRSLDKFLFDSTQKLKLDWNKRFNIVQGIAQGLLYLHQYSRLRVIHRDLKASNILLDASMNPKISDFGLARIFHGNQTEANTNRVIGTYGYMSPEYALDGIFSEKSDIYSFGVLLLEIVSAKKNTGFYPSKYSINLLGYAWELWIEDRAMELMDHSMDHSFVAREVMKCIHIGLLCVQENPADRPTMSSIVSMLGNEITTLTSPKQPAFPTVRCNAHSGPNVLCDCSINRVSLSSVEAR